MTASSEGTTKAIAILLSTGQQGSHIIKSLLQTRPTNTKFDIIGLTRDPSSATCNKLLIQFNSIESPHSFRFKKCDIRNKGELSKLFHDENIWGVYCVTFAKYDGKNQEELDGKLCIDAAIETNVSFFIFSSVVAASTAPKGATHISTKYEVEKYLMEKAQDNVFVDGWTIIRTTFYMNNLFTFHPPNNGYLTIPVIGPNTKFPVVALTNIGDIVAAHFCGDIKIDTKTHSYDCIGDEISGQKMCEILNKVSGSNIRYSNFDIVLYTLSKLGAPFAVDLMAMFNWYDSDVVHGNMKQCYDDLPDKMINFEQFAEKHFKNKNLDEPLTRKIVKYSAMIGVISAIAGGTYWYFNRK